MFKTHVLKETSLIDSDGKTATTLKQENKIETVLEQNMYVYIARK